MKSNRTELVFILDRSGSMSGLESDTIGGFNSMLKKQQNERGEANITTVLFDHNYEVLHDRLNIKGIKSITEREYYVAGSTALLDAVGRTIKKIVNVQKRSGKGQKADNVLFVIITDGMENASRRYTLEKIKSMIDIQKEKYGWEFLFLGANIDAISTAASFGISASRAANYHADGEGTRLNFETLSMAASDLRRNNSIPMDWKNDIDNDFEER